MAIHIPFSPKTYTERRQNLMQSIESGQILLMANDEASINFADNWYPYRQDSTFLYYGAISLPNMYILMDAESMTTSLFADDVSIDMVIWTGPQPKMTSLGEKVGITNVYPTSDLKKHIKGSEIHYLPSYRANHDKKLKSILGIEQLNHSLSLVKAVIAQRLIKSTEELKELNQAAYLSKQMHQTIIDHIAPGKYEYELMGIAAKFAHENNVKWSFPPILTKNGHTLHNHYHGHKIGEHDMVLVDAGIEIASGYCGDITRTSPASGKFTTEQQEIYDIVQEMYDAAQVMSRPGVRYLDVHLHTAKILVIKMKELGLMKGDVDDAVKEGAHALFFQHGLGHMMGLDVHDMENFGEEYVGYTDTLKKSTQFGLRSLRLGKELETGNVITIEPGIYFIPELIDKFQAEGKFVDFINYDAVQKKKHLGGIRLEDDFVIKSDSCEMLGNI